MNVRLLVAASLLLSAVSAHAATYEVVRTNDIVFAEHDGVKLMADFFQPKGLDKAPVLVAVHGGGWQVGSRKDYDNLGPYLAKNGYAVFSIEYRMGPKSYPGAVYDTKSAVQYVRGKAAELKIDPDRIGMIGDSAGGQLVGLVALAGEEPTFSAAYRDDPFAAVSAKVKSAVDMYGVYDMAAQWNHDLVARPRDNVSEKFLGQPLYDNRKLYWEASPISYATGDKRGLRFFVIYGMQDDIVDQPTQAAPFVIALRQAGIFVRSVVIPGAGHFFSIDPVDETSFNGFVGPRILRHLADTL